MYRWKINFYLNSYCTAAHNYSSNTQVKICLQGQAEKMVHMRDLGLVLACALVNLRDEEDYSFVVVDPLF